MKDFCIGISCVEDLSEGINYYTSLTLKHLDNLKEQGDVFVYTNNVNLFKDRGINVIPFEGDLLTVENALKLSDAERDSLDLDMIYSTHDKLNIVDYVFNLGYTGCLILDADEQLTLESNLILNKFKKDIPNLEAGFHFLGYWDSFYETQDEIHFYPQWGHLKKYDYFKALNDNISFELSNQVKPVRESNFFVRYFDEWDIFFENTRKYRKIVMKNDLTKFNWEDKKPYRPIGTGEGLSWIVSFNELNLTKYIHINELMKYLDISIIRHYHPRNDVFYLQ